EAAAVDGHVLTATAAGDYVQFLRLMVRVRHGLKREVIEPDRVPRLEQAAAIPAIALGPERERGEVRRAADRCPGVGVGRVHRAAADLAAEVDEQRTVRREV